MTAGPGNVNAETGGGDGADLTEHPPTDDARTLAATATPETETGSATPGDTDPAGQTTAAGPRFRLRLRLDAAIWAALIALLGTVITVFASHSDSGSATGAGDGAKPSATVPLTTGPTATESGGTVTSTDTDSADPATPSSTSSVSEDPTAPATTVAPPPLPTSTRHQHSVAPKPAPPNDGAAHYRYALHQGYAINLGSTSASHEATTGSWTTQNFSWGGKDDHGGDSFGISGGADSVAVLGTSAPNTHQACKSATRGGDPSLNGLNPGDRFCVFPGGFEALVTIVSNTGQFGGSDGVLTIDVLVWS